MRPGYIACFSKTVATVAIFFACRSLMRLCLTGLRIASRFVGLYFSWFLKRWRSFVACVVGADAVQDAGHLFLDDDALHGDHAAVRQQPPVRRAGQPRVGLGRRLLLLLARARAWPRQSRPRRGLPELQGISGEAPHMDGLSGLRRISRAHPRMAGWTRAMATRAPADEAFGLRRTRRTEPPGKEEGYRGGF